MSAINPEVLRKIAFLDKVIIEHRFLTHAKVGIKECLSKTEVYRESLNCMLLGVGGSGKSSLCRQLLDESPHSIVIDAECERTIIPAFYAEIPSPATIKNVAGTLLRHLNDPNPLKGNTENMTQRLCTLLKSCETRLVLLDEFHHLLDISGVRTKLNLKVCNWIKGLVNRTDVMFCLIGLPEFEPILREDDQLGRRFPLVYKLDVLSPGDGKSGTLIKFLEELEKIIKFHFKPSAFPPLSSTHMANQIYSATSGNPSFIMSLVKEALIFGLGTGGTSVSTEDFAMAWETGITATASLFKENPFRMTSGVLAGKVRR